MGIGEQLTKQSQAISITGVDMAKGIAMTDGSLDIYRQLLIDFREDAEKRLPLLQIVPEAAALSVFIIQVHSIRYDSASIGAAELSDMAAGLETAGRLGDIGFIHENMPVFIEKLTELIGRIRTWEKAIISY